MLNQSRRRGFMVLFTVAVYFLMLSVSVLAQNNARREIRIPAIRGYVTLKCDFHLHTVFSDGNVWPVTRVQEAWKEGLDAISITDHIEYQPHRADIPTKHNRPYEIALSAANSADLILIKGAEITRDTPPGHHNAIFVSEIDSLDRKDFYQAFDEAEEQGSFIFYNHPGWKHPQGIAEWFEYQTNLLAKGQLYGVEVVNGNDYYPLAHQWCIEKKLAMMGNSDEHNPITFSYDFAKGEHRPMTLVFARKRTADSIKEALFARRTAVWWKGGLIGDREFLEPGFPAVHRGGHPAIDHHREWRRESSDSQHLRYRVRNRDDRGDRAGVPAASVYASRRENRDRSDPENGKGGVRAEERAHSGHCEKSLHRTGKGYGGRDRVHGGFPAPGGEMR